MSDLPALIPLLDAIKERLDALSGGIFDWDQKLKDLALVESQLGEEDLWKDAKRLKKLNQDKNALERMIVPISELQGLIDDAYELVELIEGDESAHMDLHEDILSYKLKLDEIEFNRMFSGDYDNSNAYLEIQSGSGGTEAQDWAEMLMRMYLRFAENHQFKVETLSMAHGEVAGIKTASF